MVWFARWKVSGPVGELELVGTLDEVLHKYMEITGEIPKKAVKLSEESYFEKAMEVV